MKKLLMLCCAIAQTAYAGDVYIAKRETVQCVASGYIKEAKMLMDRNDSRFQTIADKGQCLPVLEGEKFEAIKFDGAYTMVCTELTQSQPSSHYCSYIDTADIEKLKK